MSNMAYVRFENTLRDLRDCEENMVFDADLSESENRAKEQLVALCKQIAEDYA